MARKKVVTDNHPMVDRNEDPLSGETGAHPVSVGTGTALGAIAAGAAAGSLAGPAGTVTGAILGGIAGGLAGKAVGEQLDPTVEEAYWQDEFANRDYYDPDADYNTTYGPAYRHGWESRGRYNDQSFEQAEPALRKDWEASAHRDKLEWEQARLASMDAWSRVDERYPVEPGDDVTYMEDTYIVEDEEVKKREIRPKG
jgi:hypothetical protein